MPAMKYAPGTYRYARQQMLEARKTGDIDRSGAWIDPMVEAAKWAEIMKDRIGVKVKTSDGVALIGSYAPFRGVAPG